MKTLFELGGFAYDEKKDYSFDVTSVDEASVAVIASNAIAVINIVKRSLVKVFSHDDYTHANFQGTALVQTKIIEGRRMAARITDMADFKGTICETVGIPLLATRHEERWIPEVHLVTGFVAEKGVLLPELSLDFGRYCAHRCFIHRLIAIYKDTDAVVVVIFALNKKNHPPTAVRLQCNQFSIPRVLFSKDNNTIALIWDTYVEVYRIGSTKPPLSYNRPSYVMQCSPEGTDEMSVLTLSNPNRIATLQKVQYGNHHHAPYQLQSGAIDGTKPLKGLAVELVNGLVVALIWSDVCSVLSVMAPDDDDWSTGQRFNSKRSRDSDDEDDVSQPGRKKNQPLLRLPVYESPIDAFLSSLEVTHAELIHKRPIGWIFGDEDRQVHPSFPDFKPRGQLERIFSHAGATALGGALSVVPGVHPLTRAYTFLQHPSPFATLAEPLLAHTEWGTPDDISTSVRQAEVLSDGTLISLGTDGLLRVVRVLGTEFTFGEQFVCFAVSAKHLVCANATGQVYLYAWYKDDPLLKNRIDLAGVTAVKIYHETLVEMTTPAGIATVHIQDDHFIKFEGRAVHAQETDLWEAFKSILPRDDRPLASAARTWSIVFVYPDEVVVVDAFCPAQQWYIPTKNRLSHAFIAPRQNRDYSVNLSDDMRFAELAKGTPVVWGLTESDSKFVVLFKGNGNWGFRLTQPAQKAEHRTTVKIDIQTRNEDDIDTGFPISVGDLGSFTGWLITNAPKQAIPTVAGTIVLKTLRALGLPAQGLLFTANVAFSAWQIQDAAFATGASWDTLGIVTLGAIRIGAFWYYSRPGMYDYALNRNVTLHNDYDEYVRVQPEMVF